MSKKNGKTLIWKAYLVISILLFVLLLFKLPSAVQVWRIDERPTDNVSEPIVAQESEEADEQTGQMTEEQAEKPEQKKVETAINYEEQLEELNKENEELRARALECHEQLDSLHSYTEKADELQTKYQRLSEYVVVGYRQQYDTAANDKIQQMNKANYAVGELSKRTPWGIWVNGLASMAIDGNDSYYDRVTYMNKIMANGIQDVTVSAENSFEQLNTRIKILKELTQEEDSVSKQFLNQAYLNYIFDEGGLELEPYVLDSEKKLYIVQEQLRYTYLLYNVLFMDSSDKKVYLQGIDQQYQEISEIFEELGVDPSQLVSTEELAEYMIPIMQAGTQAIDAMEENGDYVPGADSRFVDMWDGSWKTRVWYKGRFINNNTAFCTHICTQSRSSMDRYYNLYYASGIPFYINSFYFLDGKLLNDDGIVNESALLECAEWLKTNMGLVDTYEEKAFASRFSNALNGWE